MGPVLQPEPQETAARESLLQDADPTCWFVVCDTAYDNRTEAEGPRGD